MYTKKTKKGFTLIEILFVIIIIGIIASMVIISLAQSSKDKARIAKGLSYADSVRAQLSSYEVAWWKLDGNMNDNWGSNNGTLLNNINWNGSKILGSSATFNGTNSYIAIPVVAGGNLDINSTTTYVTIGAWINLNNTTGIQHIVGRRGNNGYYAINISGGKVNLGLQGCNNFNGNTTLQAGQWYYVVGVLNGASSKLFLNGVQDATGAITTICGGSGNWVSIGAGYQGASIDRYFNGIIDEVQIWNVALTAYQVQRIYAESAPRYQIVMK